MNSPYVRHIFPGGNTSLGFYSFYEYILEQDEAARIFVIKGGPGVGKSTFMKKIGEEFLASGYDIEFLHCSSDNNSLDGVVIPKIKVALIDGTAPHIVDPKNPGSVDEIINLGEFWNEEAMRSHKPRVVELTREISQTFNRAYKYLRAAKPIYDDINEIYNQSIDYSKVNTKSEDVIGSIFYKTTFKTNKNNTRHLFASAITPDGCRNYLETIKGQNKKLYILKGECKNSTSALLTNVVSKAESLGIYIEVYHCAFDPVKIEHVVINELDTTVVTFNEYHNIDVPENTQIINLDDCLDVNEIARYSSQLDFDKKIYNQLLNQAIYTLSNAKKLHDKLESYYIPNMNFKKVEQKRQEIVQKILKYAYENE